MPRADGSGLLRVNIFSGNSPWEGQAWRRQAGTLGAGSVTSLVFMRSLYAGICGLIATLDKPVNIYLESLTAQRLHEICIAKSSPGNKTF